MSVPKPVVIEAAINGGVTTLGENPHVPCTPEQVASDAAAAHDAGAAVVHLHLRQADGGRITDYSALLDAHERAFRAIRHRPAPLLWNTFPTVGAGSDAAGRFRLFWDLSSDPGTRPDLGAYDPGSLNIVWFDARRGHWMSNTYVNTWDDVRLFLEGFRQLGLRPFLNLFEPGFARATLAALDLGLLDEPLLLKFYFSERFGLPPCERSVEAYLSLFDGVEVEWFGCTIDGDVLPHVGMFAALGGHVRVGLEDFPYASTRWTNAELVGRAVAAASLSGRPVATVADARRILRLDG